MEWRLLDLAGHILLLGGTGLALRLARTLLEHGHTVTYSLAGLVRQPDLPCTIICGGFTQFGGMAQYVRTQRISLIIDATHPYAAQISANAAAAAVDCKIPCWRLQRKQWQAGVGDNWIECADWSGLLPMLAGYKRVFLSQGRLSAAQLSELMQHRQPGQQFYLRTAVKSTLDLPYWITPLFAIGPFTYADELALFRRLRIDALVSKNSGGDMTVAKLQVARALAVPVLFLRRPDLPAVDREFRNGDDILTALQKSCTLAP